MSTLLSDSVPTFYGGGGCGRGDSICTVDFWREGGTRTQFVDANGAVLRRRTAAPLSCAEACRTDAACLYAFYRFWTGDCFLMGAASAPFRIKTWVGNWRQGPQGGVTFQKYIDPPPPAPPSPISPPAAPPSWPPHQLLVDPGENVWPVEWFGNMSTTPYHQITAAEWHGEEGHVKAGFDFALPNGTLPSPRGLVTIQRAFGYNGELPNPPTIAANLPRLNFHANSVFCMWLSWNQVETAQGAYDFSSLDANFDAAVSSGWLVALRILTARLTDAPAYMAGRGIPTLDHGLNYDPADPFFHSRYLALLNALKDRGYCQNQSLAMMYVGYASHDPGDEYIGPHPTGYKGDPAVDYPHVKQRLDAWAQVCNGAVHKMLMGGRSAYGTSLGFGTRNGFVEHCKCCSTCTPRAETVHLVLSHAHDSFCVRYFPCMILPRLVHDS